MPSESSFPQFEIPKGDVWSFVFERKDQPFPDDHVILVDSETSRTYTFGQVRNATVEFGKGLKSTWEWKKGDTLCLFTPNSIDTPAVMWGVHWAGGIVSPANPAYTAQELAFQLKDSGSKAIVTQFELLKVALEAAKAVGIPEDRVILLGDQRDPEFKFKHFSSIKNLAGTNRYRRTKSKPSDLAFLPYSSGTTGKPKGVMLTHSNITSNTLMVYFAESRYMTWDKDRVIAFLPFFHIYGLTVLIHLSFYAGFEMVVMPRFDMEKFCQLVQKHKITMTYVAPPVILGLAKHPIVDKYDLSSLRMMNSGAAPLTAELVDAAYDRIKVPIKQGYGLTETSPTTHVQPWETWKTNLGSVGTLLANQTAKYVSEDGKELPEGEVGELWIKGPNVFAGYLNNEEGTKNAFSEDGYFKTGDIGYQDKEGNFYITDRVKELIKYKGFQVPPAELEGYLLSHPKIDDAAVLGLYSKEEATEVPRAYVVLKSGVEANDKMAKEISDWIAGKVAYHKRLRGGIRFIDTIPKSASGKILRRMLKEQALKEQEGTKAKL